MIYTRWIVPALLLLAVALTPSSCEQQALVVGSKKFTESVILGEIVAQLMRNTGEEVVHYPELGGTTLIFESLRGGEIDVYPEYTGTIAKEILAGSHADDDTAIRTLLEVKGVLMTEPLGFNNSYGIGMKEERAAELGITKISDLTRHPDLRLGFSNEFMDRGDGWPSLRTHYGLPQQDVRGLDHDLAYRQLDAGQIDAIDIYTTDAAIELHNLRVLEDDRQLFPRYDAVLLYRADLATRAPDAVRALHRLAGTINARAMTQMNSDAEIERIAEARIAADFLERKFSIQSDVVDETVVQRIVRRTFEHLNLVRKSLAAGILLAIPLGIWAAKRPRTGQIILGVVGIIQTIPALALLVMLMPPINALGLSSIGGGSATAIVALFLYSLLPIVRNTFTGLNEIAPSVRESAEALGLPPFARLSLIEMPIASRTILAGIKTAAVVNVGFATLGALIGAGGYGQPILTGIRLNSTPLILEGAIPAAVLAVLIQGIFEFAEHRLVPKGLRIKPSH